MRPDEADVTAFAHQLASYESRSDLRFRDASGRAYTAMLG